MKSERAKGQRGQRLLIGIVFVIAGDLGNWEKCFQLFFILVVAHFEH